MFVVGRTATVDILIPMHPRCLLPLVVLLLTMAAAPAQVSEKVLERVEIPAVNFQEVTLVEAFDFVKQQVAKQTNDKIKLNIVALLSEEEKTKPITLSLNNIPASALLRYIAQLGNVAIKYDQYAITVSSAPKSSEASG